MILGQRSLNPGAHRSDQRNKLSGSKRLNCAKRPARCRSTARQLPATVLSPAGAGWVTRNGVRRGRAYPQLLLLMPARSSSLFRASDCSAFPTSLPPRRVPEPRPKEPHSSRQALAGALLGLLILYQLKPPGQSHGHCCTDPGREPQPRRQVHKGEGTRPLAVVTEAFAPPQVPCAHRAGASIPIAPKLGTSTLLSGWPRILNCYLTL
jgi:hypothetical protein